VCDLDTVCDLEPIDEYDIKLVIDGELLVDTLADSVCVSCAEVVTERLSDPVLV
jgi:hypothetical protein